MEQGPRPSAANTNVALLNDDELYELYLRALRVPLDEASAHIVDRQNKRGAKKTTLTLKRALTGMDMPLLLGSWMIIKDFYANPIFWVPPLLLSFLSAANIAAGPFALVGWVIPQTLRKSKRPKPLRPSVNLRSAHTLAFIADYLTEPIILGSRTTCRRLAEDRGQLDRMIEQTDKVIVKLESEQTNLSDKSLADAYRLKLSEANRTLDNLQVKRKNIDAQVASIRQVVEPIEKQVSELKTLAQASQKLDAINSVIRDNVMINPQEEIAMQRIAEIQANVEMARVNLAGFGPNVDAFEEAVEEVRRLRPN